MKGCCIVGCPFFGIRGDKRQTTFHVFPDPARELYRHNQWRAACNNPRILEKSCQQVYNLYRICRRHFDSDSLNGGCRRLLSTAVPTLHLNDESTGNIYVADIDGDAENYDDVQSAETDDYMLQNTGPKRRRIDDADDDNVVNATASAATTTDAQESFDSAQNDAEVGEDGIEPIAVNEESDVYEWFDWSESPKDEDEIDAAAHEEFEASNYFKTIIYQHNG